MYIADLFHLMEDDSDPNEAEHEEALRQTGYWGKQAAGAIFLARNTRRFLIAHRAYRRVKEGGTWGTWGGAIDAGENPEAAARREALEEAGYAGHVRMIPLYVFRDKEFRYSNFLAVVDHEFKPKLNYENQGYQWCEWGKWPQPLHFGLRAVFDDPKSQATIRKILEQLSITR